MLNDLLYYIGAAIVTYFFGILSAKSWYNRAKIIKETVEKAFADKKITAAELLDIIKSFGG